MTVITWVILPVICVLAVAVYLYRKVKAAVSCFITSCSQKKQRIITVVIALMLILPAIRIYGIWFIVLLHLTVFLLLTDGIVFIIKKIRKNKDWSGFWNKIYRSGVIAMVLTAIVIGYGRYNIFHVVRTEYTVQTQKNIRLEGYRLVLLSDLHYGVSMNDEQLQKVVDRINEEKPDIVVLDGDIVDENTTLTQMVSAFKILGAIDSKYGIYYTYGNHDKNNYSTSPNYTVEKLAETIKDNNIKILEDDTAVVNNELVLIGRADRGDGNANRQVISDLVSKLDKNQEWIVLDHQPSDYENLKKSGCDIVLSGHTHAGQIWPAGLLASLFHFDALNYGMMQQGNLNAVVTSGIAGWGYPIRTEKHSEYVVLNIVPEG